MLVKVNCSSNPIPGFIGFYEGGFNFELDFRGKQIYDKDYPQFTEEGSIGCYGVCDSPDQLAFMLPVEIIHSEKKYVISMVKLEKKDQPDWGGWRWHKWGEYIGNQSPQCEYLYNEPIIETVWTYHIYEV